MIPISLVIKIHDLAIVKHGGLNGVRDESGLMSAIERPFSGFGDTEFYPSPEEKAAAIIESIVKNHPFMDGNKRTGFILMVHILNEYQKDINAPEDEIYDFVINIAASHWDYDQILSWIQTHVVEL